MRARRAIAIAAALGLAVGALAAAPGCGGDERHGARPGAPEATRAVSVAGRGAGAGARTAGGIAVRVT